MFCCFFVTEGPIAVVEGASCTDTDGNVRKLGEEWKEGRCTNCFCSSGGKACSSPMCMGPPAGQQCRVKPGTEDDCCHKYDCEVSRPCVLPGGTIHIHGHRWNVGKCMSCLCNNGSSECMSPMCTGPPMSDQYCSVRPGTEENCCPDYDCEGCVDTMGNHYTVGEMWGDPCNRCTCKGDQDAFCKTEVCVDLNPGITPPCHWIIQPDECCPRDNGPGGTVCDEPVSVCPPGSGIAPECPTHLCLEATCPNHPDALCMISRCGACHTVFYLEGYKVECGNDPITIEPVCPETVSMTCIVSPCPMEECTYHPQAVCYTDYCEPCQAVFYDKNDRPLICGDPLNILVQCKDSSSTKRAVGDMWEEGCNECTCAPSGIPKCTPKKCAIDRNRLPPLCQVVYGEVDKCCPARTVCYEAISECPSASMVAPSCPDDLCVSATCETHPEAKCRISRCGGCSVKFFDESKRHIEECRGKFVDLHTVCPNVGFVVTCFAPPCLGATCESNPDLTCHADVCQPCTPVFYDDNNNLQSCTPGTANVCNPAVKILTPRGTRTHPRCRWDGKFSPKQCDSMGYCWCVEADGSMDDTQDHSQTGHELICGFSLPCQYEVKINKVMQERGKTVTFNPTCLTNGFYDTVQCNAEECWCSEKDGTVVIGSTKPQGEPLKCSEHIFYV